MLQTYACPVSQPDRDRDELTIDHAMRVRPLPSGFRSDL